MNSPSNGFGLHSDCPPISPHGARVVNKTFSLEKRACMRCTHQCLAAALGRRIQKWKAFYTMLISRTMTSLDYIWLILLFVPSTDCILSFCIYFPCSILHNLQTLADMRDIRREREGASLRPKQTNCRVTTADQGGQWRGDGTADYLDQGWTTKWYREE